MPRCRRSARCSSQLRAATAIGVALLLPLERLAGRWATLAVVLVTSAGVGLAAVSLAMLIVQRARNPVRLPRTGLRPAGDLSIPFAEIVAIALLGASLALRAARSAGTALVSPGTTSTPRPGGSAVAAPRRSNTT